MSLTQPQDHLVNLAAHAPSTPRPAEAKAALSTWRAKAIAFGVTLTLVAAVFAADRLMWSSASLRAALTYVFSPTVFLPGIVAGFVVHEILHGVGWAEFGRMRPPAIRFALQGLRPRAHCHAPISAAAFRLGLLLPGLVLGVIPALVGLALGHGVLTVWGAIMLAMAGGDVAALWAMRAAPAHAHVRDHPQGGGRLVISNRLPCSPHPAILQTAPGSGYEPTRTSPLDSQRGRGRKDSVRAARASRAQVGWARRGDPRGH